MRSKNKLIDFDEEELKSLATSLRKEIYFATKKNGGHLSSNLGIVEIIITLLRHFDPYKDDIIFDVGHQTYAYKALTKRDLSKIRTFSGVAPFSDPQESIADKIYNGHAGSALSIAYGVAKAKKLLNDNSYTICIIGDASITNGTAFEALSLLATDKETNLIVILNDNGMGISKDVSFMHNSFVKLRNSSFYFKTSAFFSKSLNGGKIRKKIYWGLKKIKDYIRSIVLKPTIFETMGIKYMGPFDGHDFRALNLAFNKAKSFTSSPLIIHVLTIKGCGYPLAMEDEIGLYHGVNLKSSTTSFTDLKVDFLTRKMKEDNKTILLTPAMKYGSKLNSLFAQYPNRCIDVGISEEHAFSFITGISLKGLHPILDIYSTFMQRSYDQIFEDLIRNKSDSFIFVERAGLANEDGPSHHGLYDVSFLKTIPNTHIFMPYDEISFNYLTEELFLTSQGSIFFRIPKEEAIKADIISYDKEKAIINNSQSTKLFIGIGPLGYKLAKKLNFNSVILTDLLPKDEVLQELLRNKDEIFIYDAYSTKEGTSSLILQYVARNNLKIKVHYYSFAVDFYTYGSNEKLLEYYKMDVDSVYKMIEEEICSKN